MRFNNQSTFDGRKIMNVVDKPILHKKGKRWITIGLSALMLAGFGAISTGTLNVNADSTTNNPNPTHETLPTVPQEIPKLGTQAPQSVNSKQQSGASTVSNGSNSVSSATSQASNSNTNANSSASTSTSSDNNVVPNSAVSGKNTSVISQNSGSASATSTSNNVISVSSASNSFNASSSANAYSNLSNEVSQDSASVANLTQKSEATTKSATALMNRLKADMAKLSQTNLKDANSLPNFNNDVINVDTDANRPKHAEYTHVNKAPKRLAFKPYYVYSPTNIVLHSRHGALKISKQRGFTGKILRPTKLNKKRAYVVEWHNKDYVVDANQVRNVYVQPSEFNRVSRGLVPHAHVLLKKDVRVYTSVHYTNRTLRGIFKRGSKLTVIGTKSFGERGYKRTRFVLSNGLIITANKNFVQFVK